MSDTDRVTGFSHSVHDSEASAQRLMLAALAGGLMSKATPLSPGADGAKELAVFLGNATAEIAKILRAESKKT